MKKILMASLILIHSLIFLSCSSELIILFNSNQTQTTADDDDDDDLDPWQVLDKWTLMYDAAIVEVNGNAYVEITGYEFNKMGVLYNDKDRLDEGDIRIDFSFRTGPDKNPDGADGFAFTIADVPTGSDFVKYVNNVNWGGCLGYGVVGGDCAKHYTVKSFHIEFDTWWNNFEYDTNNIQMDHENHIAITRDGDPGMHHIYKTFNIEDNVWHTIQIQIQASHIVVLFDGNEIMNKIIPGFAFKGGFMMFSGSTGGWKNYHSVDNLKVYQ